MNANDDGDHAVIDCGHAGEQRWGEYVENT
jgi:hypothetical protein